MVPTQVCPVSVLSNWKAQIEEHTQGLGSCVYHGLGCAGMTAAQLAQHDIVITTYGIVVSDSRKLKRVRPPTHSCACEAPRGLALCLQVVRTPTPVIRIWPATSRAACCVMARCVDTALG